MTTHLGYNKHTFANFRVPLKQLEIGVVSPLIKIWIVIVYNASIYFVYTFSRNTFKAAPHHPITVKNILLLLYIVVIIRRFDTTTSPQQNILPASKYVQVPTYNNTTEAPNSSISLRVAGRGTHRMAREVESIT